MLPADDEAAFNEVWDYDHALGVVQDFFWYAVIWSGHQRGNYIGRKFQTLYRILARRACPGGASQQT